MYWFRRPPYLRWFSAAALVLFALWMDLRGPPVELRPFVIEDMEAGSPMNRSVIEYREVPRGLLPEVTPEGYAAAPIGAGEPVTSAALTHRAPLPEGWWAIEIQIPVGASPGTELRLIVNDGPGSVVPARVLSVGVHDDGYGWSENLSMVAVPADQAATVAAAATRAALTVLVADF